MHTFCVVKIETINEDFRGKTFEFEHIFKKLKYQIPLDHIWLTLTLFFNKTSPFLAPSLSRFSLLFSAIPQCYYQFFPAFYAKKPPTQKIDIKITVFYHQKIYANIYFRWRVILVRWREVKWRKKKLWEGKSTFDLMRNNLWIFTKMQIDFTALPKP